MPRMRTIKAAVEYIRQKDPETSVSEWWARQLVKRGKLKHHKAGNKVLIDLDYFEEFLKNPPEEETPATEENYGVLRKIQG
ncbi:MAG: DNA-binding protein [Acetivibrionales bacterium]